MKAILALLLIVAIAAAVPMKKTEDIQIHIDVPAACELCELVVKAAEAYVEENTTVAELEAGLEKICNILPSHYHAVCELAKGQVPELLELLLKKETPQVVCSQLKMCASQDVPNDWKCSLCELVIGKLESMIAGNRTEQKIIEALDNVCNMLPGFQSVCREFVQEYTPELIQLLEEYENPEAVCTQLGLCGQKKVEVKKVEASPIECELCTLVVGEVYKLIESNKTEEAIKKALEQVCNRFGKWGSICDMFVDQYIDELIELIINFESADKVCQQLQLCTAAAAQKPKTGEVTCVLCKMAIQYFQLALKNETKDVQALERLCNYLPGSVGKDCKALVDLYGDIILEYLESMSPEQICSLIKVCTAERASANMLPKCTMCELLVGEASSLLADGKAQEFIIAELDKLCLKLPTDYQDLCKDAVAAVVPDMIKLLEAKIDPEQVCTFLKICPKVGMARREKTLDYKCTLCKWAAEIIEDLIEANRTQQQIKTALEAECQQLGPFKSECTAFVDDYALPLINQLIQHETPDDVCEQLGLCTSGKNKRIGMMMMHRRVGRVRLN